MQRPTSKIALQFVTISSKRWIIYHWEVPRLSPQTECLRITNCQVYRRHLVSLTVSKMKIVLSGANQPVCKFIRRRETAYLNSSRWSRASSINLNLVDSSLRSFMISHIKLVHKISEILQLAVQESYLLIQEEAPLLISFDHWTPLEQILNRSNMRHV